MPTLKAVAVGCGYFSRFHFDAWSRLPDVELVAVCDVDEARVEAVFQTYGIPRRYTDVRQMLDTERPDFIDIITRPDSHAAICREAGQRGVHVICQKPLAPTLAESTDIVNEAEAAGVRLMVHENFRFQPWYREIRRLLDEGQLGDRLHSLTFVCRPGDGWGPTAYLDRQPYFREMPRLLLYETGVHFIDTFRYLGGEVSRVFCHLRRLNPVIAGEDCGLLLLDFDDGATGLWDANRWNESNAVDPRYTFGQFLVEGSGGTIRLAHDGSMMLKPLGEPEQVYSYEHSRQGFGGDCVFATQQHFVDSLLSGNEFETAGRLYLRNLTLLEAAYQSAVAGRFIDVSQTGTPSD